MPIYEVGGKKYEFDEALTPEELDELKQKVGVAPAAQPKPEVTVTRLGDREIEQPEETAPQEPAGVGEYLLNALKKGVINAPAALDALLRAGYGKMAEAELAKSGAIAPEETMKRVYGMGEKPKPVVQAASEAFTESQRRIAPAYKAVGFEPPKVDMRAPGPISEVVGAGIEAAADPTSYLGGVGLIKTPVRAVGEFLTGTAAEIGGKAGAEVERAVTGGEESGAGRLVGSLLGGMGTAAPREVATDTLSRSIEQLAKNRSILKGTPQATETYARGAAKNLLDLAAKEQGAESVEALIQLVNDASQFVNKADAPLVIAMADNPVIRQQVERLAKINPSFRERVNRVVEQASSDIQSKSEKMFGKPYGAEVKPEAGLKVKPVVERRRKDIERQLTDITEGVTPAVDPETLGKQIESLVEERKSAARKELAPKYQELLDEARAKGIEMPSEGVQQIYDFVVQNNLRDIFGKGTPLDRKIMSYLEPKKVEGEAPPAILGPDGKPISQAAKVEGEYPTLSFDNLDSLKRAINEIKRGKLSDDARRKVNQLEQVVDGARDTIPEGYSKRLADIDLEYYNKVGVPFTEQGIKDIDAKKYATQVAPVVVKNAESYNQFIRAVGKEAGDSIAENAIIAEVYQKAVKDGMLNAGQLAKYLKDKKEVVSQIPGLEDRLRQAVLDDRQLRARMDSLDKAAKAAETRVANNALTQFDAPDYATLASNIINNPRQRQKIMRDIGDLDADTAKAVRNALRVEAVNIGRRNAGGFMQYVSDPANKAGIDAIFGQAFQPSLRRLALFSDKVSAADISKLGVAIDRRELDALAQIVPGIDIPYLSSTLRDRISSLPQKVVRLLSKYNSSKLSTATDDAIMELLLDPNGVQKLANTVTNIKFDLSNPAALGKMADSLARVIPRSFYTSGKTALAGEERSKAEQEARAEEAADFIPGGFEEEPEGMAEGGMVDSGEDYTKYNARIMRALIKRYGSEAKAREIMRTTDGGELLQIMREEESKSAYTRSEQDLLRRYADGGSAKRPTLPADRYAGYKQVGESDDRLLRFFEAAARELPDAIKQSVTSNADLAAKYLKFKFGMMSPEEMIVVARALPESLKGAAVAAMQAVKEAPKAVAEATPETAGKFVGQMIAGEMTDPTRIGRAARAVTKPVISEMGDVSSIDKFKSKKLADKLEKKISNKNWLFKPEKTNAEIAAELAKVRNQSALNEYIDLSFSKTPPHTEERYSEIYRLENLQKELKPDLSPEVYEMLAKGRRISKAERTPAPAAKPIEKPQPKESGVYELGTGRKIAETYDLDDIPESPFKELVQQEHAAATKLLKIKDQSLIDRYINLQKEKEKFSFDDDRRLDIEDEIDSISEKLSKDLDESSSHLLYDTSTDFDNSKEFRKFLNLTPQQRLQEFEKNIKKIK